jgi:hypothetical protein
MEYIFYKISCLDNDVPHCYIGSTKNLPSRTWQHKCDCNNPNRHAYNSKVYTKIRSNGGWYNWKIETIGAGIFDTRIDALNQEQQYIKDHNADLNTYRARMTKEDENEIKRQYVINNHAKVLESRKKYRDANKDKLKEKIKNDKILQDRRKEKTLCTCGGSYVYSHKAEHMKSKKHINHVNNNIIDV